MSRIAEKFSVKQEKALPAEQVLGVSYQLIGGRLIPIPDNTANYVKKGYNINDVIYSVINLILDKIRVAPWSVYEITNESSLKEYRSIIGKRDFSGEDFSIAKKLRQKAISVVNKPGKWGDLLEYPNDEDTFSGFVANSCGYKMITGNTFIWANRLDMGANAGYPQELWLMPTQFMQIFATNSFPIKAVGYNMFLAGINNGFDYDVSEVLHNKYYNYDYSINGSHLMGMSPLKAGLKRMNNSNSTLDVSTAKMQNGGLEKIIFLDDPSANKQDAQNQMVALKAKLIHEYTGPTNYGKLATSGYKIGAVDLGLSPVELAIIESQQWDLRMFCNLFGGVPSQMLNDPATRTYNNSKEGEKALTGRCAVTLLNSFRDSFNRMGHAYWKLPPNWIVDYDITVYRELQEDMTEMMAWVTPLANLTGISPNRILDLAGLEKIDDPKFDEPWIRPTMGQPLSEWELNPVDQALNSGQ